MPEINEDRGPKQSSYYLKRYLGFILLSIGLSRLPIANMFIAVPLLFLAPSCRTKVQAYLSFLIVLVVTVVLAILEVQGFGNNSLSLSLVLVTTFVPIVELITAALWVQGKDKGINDFANYFINCIVAFVITLALVLFFYLTPDRLEELISAYANMLVSFGIEEMVPGIDAQALMQSIVNYGITFGFAAIMGIVGINLFMSETLRNRRNEAWKKRIGTIKFPFDAIWIFLVLFALVLLSFFITLPQLINIIIGNLWGFMILLYALQGFSIYIFKLKQKSNVDIDVFKILLNQLIFLLLPIFNVIILIMFPLMGILDNWIEFRKTKNNKET